MEKDAHAELNAFVAEWPETPEGNREVFQRLRGRLDGKEGVALEFVPRPGVTYSLRAVHAGPGKNGLLAMVDVIEDSPRWLSVCFYREMITDPEQRGSMVPGGLLGEDAVCFDIDKRDDEFIRYVELRLDEACRKALPE